MECDVDVRRLSIPEKEVSDMSRLVGLNLEENHFQQTLEESKLQAARLGLEGFEDTLAKEKLEEQLAMAREIQQHLLPQALPEISGCPFNTGHIRFDMTFENTSRFSEICDRIINIEKTEMSENGINARCGMPVTYHNSISIFFQAIFRIYICIGVQCKI